MRRGLMMIVLAMFVLVTGTAARGAAAEEMQLVLPINSGEDVGPVPHGSVTINVLKCNPGTTIVTLDPAGCTADNSGVEFALWDVEYQQNYSQIQAIDNGNGSFTWGGLMIEDAIDGQGDGDHVGFYELSLIAAPDGAINWAGFGNYDQNFGYTYIHTDYPAAWIDFYFFFPEEEHDPGDWIDNGDEEPKGAVSVNAFLCAPGFEANDPDWWAANCQKSLDGVAFTLTHLDSPYVETRATGDDGFGNALFQMLDKGTYELTFELFEGMLFGDGFCNQANQSGEAGVYGLGVEPGVGTTCSYYIVLDPQNGGDAPEGDPEGEDEPVDEPEDEDEDEDGEADEEELDSVTTFPNTGVGSATAAGTNQTVSVLAVAVSLLIGLAAAAFQLRRSFLR